MVECSFTNYVVVGLSPDVVKKNVFEIMALPNNVVLICRLKDHIIFCPIHSLGFVKNAFSAKIWFVKTSTRIVKSES